MPSASVTITPLFAVCTAATVAFRRTCFSARKPAASASTSVLNPRWSTESRFSLENSKNVLLCACQGQPNGVSAQTGTICCQLHRTDRNVTSTAPGPRCVNEPSPCQQKPRLSGRNGNAPRMKQAAMSPRASRQTPSRTGSTQRPSRIASAGESRRARSHCAPSYQRDALGLVLLNCVNVLG